MFDIIFISFEEENANENFELLLDIAPHAQRVHGIKGIAQAHIAAAKLVSTSHFFTIDADNIVDENFDWENIIDFQKNDQRIHVWRAKNNVNGLVYGYGGVKLWPTDHIKNIKEYATDFTTSVATHGLKVQNTIASITVFNTSPYNAWKSGYRECTKLASEIIHNADERSMNRLLVWLSIGADSQYGDYTILGARMGALNGLRNKDDNKALVSINDFDFCKLVFDDISTAISLDIERYGEDIAELLGKDIVLYDSKQSKQIKEFVYSI